MYRQQIVRKIAPTQQSTPISQNSSPSKSFGSLSEVVQRATNDSASVSREERQQLDGAIGTRATTGILSGAQTPWTPNFTGITTQLMGDSGRGAASFVPAEEKRGEESTNQTGLPDNLKSGIENLSGYSMDDVKVHCNSDKPAQLQAHAYAQGTDIYIAPGQEKHLPHEAWHVAQQKQGRVQATTQMKSVLINDSPALEKEADVMGALALNDRGPEVAEGSLRKGSVGGSIPVQGMFDKYQLPASSIGLLVKYLKQSPVKKNIETLNSFCHSKYFYNPVNFFIECVTSNSKTYQWEEILKKPDCCPPAEKFKIIQAWSEVAEILFDAINRNEENSQSEAKKSITEIWRKLNERKLEIKQQERKEYKQGIIQKIKNNPEEIKSTYEGLYALLNTTLADFCAYAGTGFGGQQNSDDPCYRESWVQGGALEYLGGMGGTIQGIYDLVQATKAYNEGDAEKTTEEKLLFALDVISNLNGIINGVTTYLGRNASDQQAIKDGTPNQRPDTGIGEPKPYSKELAEATNTSTNNLISAITFNVGYLLQGVSDVIAIRGAYKAGTEISQQLDDYSEIQKFLLQENNKISDEIKIYLRLMQNQTKEAKSQTNKEILAHGTHSLGSASLVTGGILYFSGVSAATISLFTPVGWGLVIIGNLINLGISLGKKLIEEHRSIVLERFNEEEDCIGKYIKTGILTMSNGNKHYAGTRFDFKSGQTVVNFNKNIDSPEARKNTKWSREFFTQGEDRRTFYEKLGLGPSTKESANLTLQGRLQHIKAYQDIYGKGNYAAFIHGLHHMLLSESKHMLSSEQKEELKQSLKARHGIDYTGNSKQGAENLTKLHEVLMPKTWRGQVTENTVNQQRRYNQDELAKNQDHLKRVITAMSGKQGTIKNNALTFLTLPSGAIAAEAFYSNRIGNKRIPVPLQDTLKQMFYQKIYEDVLASKSPNQVQHYSNQIKAQDNETFVKSIDDKLNKEFYNKVKFSDSDIERVRELYKKTQNQSPQDNTTIDDRTIKMYLLNQVTKAEKEKAEETQKSQVKDAEKNTQITSIEAQKIQILNARNLRLNNKQRGDMPMEIWKQKKRDIDTDLTNYDNKLKQLDLKLDQINWQPVAKPTKSWPEKLKAEQVRSDQLGSLIYAIAFAVGAQKLTDQQLLHYKATLAFNYPGMERLSPAQQASKRGCREILKLLELDPDISTQIRIYNREAQNWRTPEDNALEVAKSQPQETVHYLFGYSGQRFWIFTGIQRKPKQKGTQTPGQKSQSQTEGSPKHTIATNNSKIQTPNTQESVVVGLNESENIPMTSRQEQNRQEFKTFEVNRNTQSRRAQESYPKRVEIIKFKKLDKKNDDMEPIWDL